MSPARCWILFAVCSIAWIVVFLVLPPSFSGEDVFIFRDAGWNLASSGRFETAAMPQSHDLVPRFYAHYPPGLPLLFAAYAWAFPRNAYAGTFFYLLIAFAAAATVTWCVLKQPPGRMRKITLWLLAAASPLFITQDRPASLALIPLSLTLAVAASARPRPIVIGLLVGLTFLVHPFAAVVAWLWMVAFFVIRAIEEDGDRIRTMRQLAVATASCLALLAMVAIVYFLIDPDSLHRFTGHALGANSGLGVAARFRSLGQLGRTLHFYLFIAAPATLAAHLAAIVICGVLIVWGITRGRRLNAAQTILISTSVLSLGICLCVFPAQIAYLDMIGLAIPIGILCFSRRAPSLAIPALALLLIAIGSRLPSLALNLITRAELRPSYRAAQNQPAFLRAHLADPDPIVVMEGGSYDLFKPEFPRLVTLDFVASDRGGFSAVAAVANCFQMTGFENDSKLPGSLNPQQFRLLQRGSQRRWITLFGHRIRRGQWGFGCDLYTRDNSRPVSSLY